MRYGKPHDKSTTKAQQLANSDELANESLAQAFYFRSSYVLLMLYLR